jgi:hypothetical protein
MTTDEKMKMNVETTIWIVGILIIVGLLAVVYFWGKGLRNGTCTEMCRPAQFDSGQDVNGGCLCIGSDKVLRIRPAP